MKNNQQITLEYAPCSQESLSAFIYLVIGSGMAVYAFIESFTFSNNLLFMVTMCVAFLGALYKLTEIQRNKQPKKLKLTDHELILPNKVNNDYEIIPLAEIEDLNMRDVYIELRTTKGHRDIDCSWIADKFQLDEFIYELNLRISA